jgi:hypothetical protein
VKGLADGLRIAKLCGVMTTRWECRYSSSEMMYMEIVGHEVRMWLHHSPQSADRYSLEDVLAGKLDAEVRNLFGLEAVDELRAAVSERVANPNPKVETKQEAMLRRRREG